MEILEDKDNEGMEEEVRVSKGEAELLLLLLNTAVPETLPPLVPVMVPPNTVLVGVRVLVPEEASEGVSTQEKGERNEVLDTEADDVGVNPFTPPVSVLVNDPTGDGEKSEEYEGEEV